MTTSCGSRRRRSCRKRVVVPGRQPSRRCRVVACRESTAVEPGDLRVDRLLQAGGGLAGRGCEGDAQAGSGGGLERGDQAGDRRRLAGAGAAGEDREVRRRGRAERLALGVVDRRRVQALDRRRRARPGRRAPVGRGARASPRGSSARRASSGRGRRGRRPSAAGGRRGRPGRRRRAGCGGLPRATRPPTATGRRRGPRRRIRRAAPGPRGRRRAGRVRRPRRRSRRGVGRRARRRTVSSVEAREQTGHAPRDGRGVRVVGDRHEPASRSERATTSAAGGRQDTTPNGTPSTAGVVGPAIPRRKRYSPPPRCDAGS